MPIFYFDVRCREHLFPDRSGQAIEAEPGADGVFKPHAAAAIRGREISLLRDPDCVVEVLGAERDLRATFATRELLDT